MQLTQFLRDPLQSLSNIVINTMSEKDDFYRVNYQLFKIVMTTIET